MDAKDLMLGDWMGWLPTWKNEETGEIEWDGDRNEPIIGKVGMLMKDCTTIDYCDESIEVEDIGLIPIPLTPEIMEKNFEKKTFYGIYDDYYDLDIREYSDGLYIVTYHSCEFNIPDQTIHLSWVHELQHFMRHCGIEKEIIM